MMRGLWARLRRFIPVVKCFLFSVTLGNLAGVYGVFPVHVRCVLLFYQVLACHHSPVICYSGCVSSGYEF